MKPQGELSDALRNAEAIVLSPKTCEDLEDRLNARLDKFFNVDVKVMHAMPDDCIVVVESNANMHILKLEDE